VTRLASRPATLWLRRMRPLLFVAFAFAIMADPVSSVAYTIEASLRSLHGHLGLLLATQIIVLGIIALVDINYWQLVGRFPLGGGSAEAAARAFGTGWVFIPIGPRERRVGQPARFVDPHRHDAARHGLPPPVISPVRGDPSGVVHRTENVAGGRAGCRQAVAMGVTCRTSAGTRCQSAACTRAVRSLET
jgi:hypothetical protein